MKAKNARGRILNELIFTLRTNTTGRRRRVSVDVANHAPRDLPFLRAIAGVVAVWFNRAKEE